MKQSWSSRPSCAARAAAIALLALAPLAAAARESISNQLVMGICRKTSLGPELEMCSREGGSSGAAGASAGRAGAAGGVASGASSSESFASVWSHTSPCLKNSTDGTEFCVFTSTAFADNHGITLLTTPKRAAHFAAKDAFVDPASVRGVNRDTVSEAEHGTSLPPLGYRVEAMPGKGYGVVATRFLNRGDLVMSTTASAIVDYAVYESMAEADVYRLLAAAVGNLPDLHRARFMNLSTHDGAEGHEETVAKIVTTNAFDIEADDGEGHGFFVVFPEISRLNHDCRPNADYHFDPETLTQHIYAVRPIAAGEEITVSYIDLVQKRKQRMAKLKATWGFECGCSLCTQSRTLGEASDARIAQIGALRGEFRDYTTTSRATPEMAELFVSLYQQERLDAMLYEAYSYAAMEWNGVGQPWMATKYARLAIEFGLASVGTHDVDVDEMRQLAGDPFAHWSWMLRTSRRMQWSTKEQTAKQEEES